MDKEKRKQDKNKGFLCHDMTWSDTQLSNHSLFSLCQEDVGLSKLLFLCDVHPYNLLKSDLKKKKFIVIIICSIYKMLL